MSAQAIRVEKIQDKQMSFSAVVGRLVRVKVKTQEQNRLTVASLFAGVGGIDLAFQNAGFQIEWANEIDKQACETYSSNFTHKIICDDIKNLDTSTLSKVDILTGGFPCQAFSIAGHRKGFDDERGSLVFELLRIVNELIARNGKNDEYFKYIDNLGIFADSPTSYSVQNQEIVKQLASQKQNIFDGVVNKINWADPWLIAIAKSHNLMIITTERDDPKRDKLPTLARLFNVQCIDKNSFLKQEGWRF